MEKNKTVEARFANAINKLDPVVQEMNSKSAWKGWSRDFLLEKKEKFFVEFPQINKEFHEILNHMDSQGFFEKY